MYIEISSKCSQPIPLHTLYAYTFAFKYIYNDMKINMVFDLHCHISIYYNQNLCFLITKA